MAKSAMHLCLALLFLSAAISLWLVADSVRQRNEFIRLDDGVTLRTNGDTWSYNGEWKFKGNLKRIANTVR
jgi:hypothetical protein